MGLFDTVSAPSWQGATTTKNTSRYNLADLWKQYNPQLQQSTLNPNEQTKYSGAENSAIAALSDIIKNQGYSQQQKQSLFNTGATPVLAQAEEQRRQAQADAYARGLGQSGVLSRSYGEVDKNTQNALAQLASTIEQQSAASYMPAIQAVQTGQQNLMQMAQQQSQFNTQMAQERENLAAQLNMSAGDLAAAVAKINSAAESSDADRAVQLQQIMNQFNLDAAEMQMLQNEAKKDRWASFFSNIFGGAADIAGSTGLFGAFPVPGA